MPTFFQIMKTNNISPRLANAVANLYGYQIARKKRTLSYVEDDIRTFIEKDWKSKEELKEFLKNSFPNIDWPKRAQKKNTTLKGICSHIRKNSKIIVSSFDLTLGGDDYHNFPEKRILTVPQYKTTRYSLAPINCRFYDEYWGYSFKLTTRY